MATMMRFESHFKSYFGNVKAFNLKKIKIIAEPVAAGRRRPCGWGPWQASSLLGRPKALPGQGYAIRKSRGISRATSDFQVGNVKAFNSKKIKIIAEPVAAMAGDCPAAGGRRPGRASFLGRA